MSKKFLITIATLLIIGAIASLAIFYAKGYRFSSKEKRVVGTGILTVSSLPDSASVYIDGHLTTATNATIPSLSPKDYSLKIIKEGFIPWEKTVTVKEGLVSEVKVTLFPAIPTIYPLTFSGVTNPVLSPDGSKLLYIVTSGKKAGLWVWTMVKSEPLSFTRNSEPHQIATNLIVDFSKAVLRWSPDSKQVLARLPAPERPPASTRVAGGAGNTGYLLSSDQMNSDPKDITATLQVTLKAWDEDIKTRADAQINAIRELKLRKIASDAARLQTPEVSASGGQASLEPAGLSWSPDETKFMVKDKLSKDDAYAEAKIYDSGENILSPVPFESSKEYILPKAKNHLWLPDSKHIILVEDQTISLVDFDGSNKAVIFAGSFLNNFVFPWPDSSRLVIISTLPTPTASEPNFYGINLK